MCAWARVQACKTFNPVTVHLSTEQEKARMSWVIRVVQRRPLSCLLKMSTNPKQNRCLIQLCSHCACVGVAVDGLVCVCVRAEVWVFHKVLERKVTTKNNATCCHQCEAFYSNSRHVCSCCVCVFTWVWWLSMCLCRELELEEFDLLWLSSSSDPERTEWKARYKE